MSEWISKAANVFKRDVSETPQPFEVRCECGLKHSGLRRARHQHLICKGCNVSLFVLPHDVYPQPHVPKPSDHKKKRKTVPRPSAGMIDLSPEPLLNPAQDEPEVSPQKKRRKQGSKTAEPAVELTERRNIVIRIVTRVRDTIHGFWTTFWEFWTPYRKLALLICCLLGATAYFSIRQSYLRDAVTVAKTELDLGLDSIASEDWVQARRHFELAANAVDLLGRDDLEANAIRQYFRETTALTRLTSTSLFELIEDAESYYVEHGTEEWQRRFETRYQDSWYVIEGYVRPTIDRNALANGFPLELVFPVTVGTRQRPVNVQLDFRLAAHLPRISGDGQYDTGDGMLAVFGAQLSECFIGLDGSWIVRFNPESSFLWFNQSTYEATHLNIGSIQPAAEQQQMFQLQGKWMGVRQ